MWLQYIASGISCGYFLYDTCLYLDPAYREQERRAGAGLTQTVIHHIFVLACFPLGQYLLR